MTGEDTGIFNAAVDALQNIINSSVPVGSVVVGPKFMPQDLSIETLNDVAKGLTVDGEHPAWTDSDRANGIHALGTFFLSLRENKVSPKVKAHFQYDRNDLITLLDTLQALKGK